MPIYTVIEETISGKTLNHGAVIGNSDTHCKSKASSLRYYPDSDLSLHEELMVDEDRDFGEMVFKRAGQGKWKSCEPIAKVTDSIKTNEVVTDPVCEDAKVAERFTPDTMREYVVIEVSRGGQRTNIGTVKAKHITRCKQLASKLRVDKHSQILLYPVGCLDTANPHYLRCGQTCWYDSINFYGWNGGHPIQYLIDNSRGQDETAYTVVCDRSNNKMDECK